VLRVQTFGRLHVRGPDGVVSGAAAQPRRLAILALLATAGEQGLTREKVLAYLWPDTDEDRARRGLSQALYALRQDLGADDVFLGNRDLRLNGDLMSSDVGEFGQALAGGRLEVAAGQYTGAFLDGFHLPGAPEFDRWAEEERAGLAHRYAQSLEKLARAAAQRGDVEGAVGWWRKLAAQDPLNARVAVGLMRALVAAGDRAGALQHARVYEVLMEQDLDAPPDREVLALAAELRRAEEAPAAKTTAAAVRAPPAVTTAHPPSPPLPETPPPAASPAAVASPVARPAEAPLAPVPATPPSEVGQSPPSPASPIVRPDVEAIHAPPAAARRRLRVPVRQALLVAALLGAGFVAGVLLRPAVPPKLAPGTASRVAFDEWLEISPAISPDGKMIAYAADVGDRFQLFVRRTSGGPAVAVSAALPGSHWRPVWSPDGNRLAFQSAGSIYVVDALGGSPRLLVRPSRADGWVAYPTWSPDGRSIAYAENWAVYVMPAGGGAPKLISDRMPAHSLAWSPDGNRIAFVSGNPVFAYGETPWGSPTNLGNLAPSSIWVVSAHGGTPVQVTDAQSLNTSPVWLPGGGGLLFVSNRDGGRDVYRVALDRAGRAAERPERLTTGLNAHTISLSADAGQLAYSVFTHTGNIWAVPIPTRGTATVADASPFTEGSQVIEGIAVSPDGRWLAFDSDREGNQNVYRMPAAGGEAVQLTGSPDDEFVSSWSGDGREIALHAYHGGGRVVRIVSAEGGEPRDVLASPPNQRSPGFAPDGRHLVFTAEVSGQRRLFLTTRTGGSWGAARQLTPAEGWAGRWAPDGHAIVYCRSDGLWLISPQGGGLRQLVAAGNSATQPGPELALWSPDGGTIYYKAFDASGRSSLWAVPAAGGQPRLLMRFDDPARPSTRPEFATDGKRLFFTVGARQSDVWEMELRRQP
jgi:Tol biopolymer transport system component/DNA-binding SARP family transcriptional activator